MNEKIKQLLAQAHLEVEDTKDTNKIAEKFAEFIIQECANIAWNNEPDGEISDLIKEHFGVE